MRLVDVAVLDVLVVVDGLCGVLEETGLLGLLEITDVPDESNGVTVGARASTVSLVELIVEDKELLVLGVKNPALVSVRSTLVRNLGDDVGDVGLVSHIVDGEGILVVSVADITALVTLVGSTVDNALSVVHVAIALGTSKRLGVGRISEIEEVQTGQAVGVCSWLGADGNGVLELLVDNNIVSSANRQQFIIMTGKIRLCVKDNGLLGVDLEKLSKVEDLDTVTNSLGSDDDKVLVCADLSPLRNHRVLGQTAEVDELTLLGDLGKGCAVVLADGNELTAVVGGPSPGGRTPASGAAKSAVAQERVQIGLDKSQCCNWL